MKLKALKPRLHNAMFHTHTVSGIVISFALFICFYCGAVALFLDELHQWENPESRIELVEASTVDYDAIIDKISNRIPDFNVTGQFGIVPPKKSNPLVWFYGSTKDEEGTVERFTATIDPNTYEVLSIGKEPKTHMGRTIYELHFFHQIPVIGIYLSGLVAFFFLFAIVTGLLTHWKNIVNRFYSLTVEGKWKQIWTNSHISLGFIALPFQMIYAVTGALLGLSILLLAPSAFLLFDGDTSQVIKAVVPAAAIKYDEDAAFVENDGIGFNSVFQEVNSGYPENEVTYIYANNFGKEDGTITVRVDDHTGISGDGTFVYGYKDGELVGAIEPVTKSYSEGAYNVLIKLHYVTYGGIFLKIIYFILAMITCYIIMSGVMIWRTARDNKKYTDKQRRFHHRVTKVYLAITLSLFPALALIFLANKAVPLDLEDRVFYVNSIFFSGWLVLTIIGLFWNNYRKLNRNYVFLGSLFGLLIPIANGWVTGDWIWKAIADKQHFVYSVDITWLVIGISGLLISRYYLTPRAKVDKPHETKRKVELIPEKPIIREEPQPVLQSISKTE
ncbi:MAG: PepSY-associated TM helix domain-containing protein [Bacteroidota bacterium]